MKSMKLLVLVIASEDYPYSEFLNVWQSRKYPDWITIRYTILKPDITNDIEQIGDSIYVKGEESIIPGIWKKTRAAMKYCLENEEFDYLLRSNLSSFFRFDLLYKVLEQAARENVVGGVMMHNNQYGEFLSGSGYLMSRDIVEDFLEWPFEYPTELSVHDDIQSSYYFRYNDIPIIQWQLYYYSPGKELHDCNDFHLRFCSDRNNRNLDIDGYKKAIELFDR
jgi:hypothetical protein